MIQKLLDTYLKATAVLEMMESLPIYNNKSWITRLPSARSTLSHRLSMSLLIAG
jgi:hypothetical protein